VVLIIRQEVKPKRNAIRLLSSMKTNIKVIPHKKQRYPTVGDWWWDKNNTLQIRVSEMSDPLFEQLVAFHELIVAQLCDQAGVTEEEVTAFDKDFERRREVYKWEDDREPGDDPAAPYYQQHQIASAYERLLAVTLGVNWQEYNKEVNAL
jgi:hypothetical protein